MACLRAIALPSVAPGLWRRAALPAATTWLLTGALCLALALLSGVEMRGLRTLMPYLTWVLLAPAAAWWGQRHPPFSTRNVLLHLATVPLALVIVQAAFRGLYFLLSGTFERPALEPGYVIPATATVLLLYAGTLWPVAALANLGRAHDGELQQAATEAQQAGDHLDLSLARLGPHELEHMLGRVRSLAASAPSRADDAVDALGRYLRLALRAVEEPRWTWGRELEMAQAFLDFESSCAGRSLAIDDTAVSPSHLDRPLRQHTLVAAMTPWIATLAGPQSFTLEIEAGCVWLVAASVEPDGEPLRIEVGGG